MTTTIISTILRLPVCNKFTKYWRYVLFNFHRPYYQIISYDCVNKKILSKLPKYIDEIFTIQFVYYINIYLVVSFQILKEECIGFDWHIYLYKKPPDSFADYNLLNILFQYYMCTQSLKNSKGPSWLAGYKNLTLSTVLYHIMLHIDCPSTAVESLNYSNPELYSYINFF